MSSYRPPPCTPKSPSKTAYNPPIPSSPRSRAAPSPTTPSRPALTTDWSPSPKSTPLTAFFTAPSTSPTSPSYPTIPKRKTVVSSPDTANVETDLYKRTEDQLRRTFTYATPEEQQLAKTLRSGVGFPVVKEDPLPEGAPADFRDKDFSLTGAVGSIQPTSSKDVKSLEIDEKTINRHTIKGITAKSYNPFATAKLVESNVNAMVESDRKRICEAENVSAELLLGHHPDLAEFGKRELVSTYDLSYNQKVEPKTQVNSFYTPDLAVSAKHFHKELAVEKQYQTGIPDVYDRKQLQAERVQRPYRPHVKYFDAEHMKTPYLRK